MKIGCLKLDYENIFLNVLKLFSILREYFFNITLFHNIPKKLIRVPNFPPKRPIP
jgi:hypothetical protein